MCHSKDSSPSAYPHLSTGALDDLQYDYTTLLHQTLSHPSLHPSNLGIIKGKKAWLLSLDLVVLSDSGNVYDALFMAARAALWDTKVPRTRSIEYRANAKGGAQFGGGRADMDVDEDNKSGFDTRQVAAATDFELEDYWDEGEVLNGREKWPVCVTLNLVRALVLRTCLTLGTRTNMMAVTASSNTLPRCNIARRSGHAFPTFANILWCKSARDAFTGVRRGQPRSDEEFDQRALPSIPYIPYLLRWFAHTVFLGCRPGRNTHQSSRWL